MRRRLIFAAIGTACTAASPPAPALDGRWLTADRKGEVTISRCGGEVLCGWITRVLDSGQGVPSSDVRNPDARLRSRPILGLPVLTGFRPGTGEWTGGRAYDPKTGSSYRARLARNGDGSLRVTGCVLFVCLAQRWTRIR
ncbi:MAG: DUF2147 domain-containing protein [Novosphingobium sp.]|nr:DUF2147 domain-containing protein [Novosphingobium sp.]